MMQTQDTVIKKLPLWGLFLLTFFLPFERIGSLDLSGTTIRISQVALLFLLSVIIVYLWQKRPLFSKSLALPLIGYGIIAIFSLAFSVNLERSITVLLFQLFTMSLIFVLPILITQKRLLKHIVLVLIATSVIVALFGLFQFIADSMGLPNSITGLRTHYQKGILGFPRIQSTALEPLYFANFLLIPIGILASFVIQKSKQQIWLLLILLLLVTNVLLTSSRGALIALAIMGVIFCIVYYKRIFTARVIASLLILTTVSFGVSSLLLEQDVTPIESERSLFISHLFNWFDGAAFVERIQMYEHAYPLFLSSPLFGIGVGAFGPAMSRFVDTPEPSGWPIVNNQLLETLTETGILGLFFLGVFITLFFLEGIKAIRQSTDIYYKTLLTGILIVVFGICVQYMTFSTLYIMHIWFVIGLGVATMQLAKRSA